MRITVIGRGHVGGALARRWTAAGHDVTALGRDGGDAAGADVVVVVIPGDSVAVGLAKIAGLDGQVTIHQEPSSRPTPMLARRPSNSSGTQDSSQYTLATWRRLRCWKVLSPLTSTLDGGELSPFFYRFRRAGELEARLGLGLPQGCRDWTTSRRSQQQVLIALKLTLGMALA